MRWIATKRSVRADGALAASSSLVPSLAVTLAACLLLSLAVSPVLLPAQAEDHKPSTSPASPAQVTSIAQLKALSIAAADARPSARVVGVVTYAPPQDNAVFLQDGPDGVYVDGLTDAAIYVGDLIEVVGHAQGSFKPILHADSFRLLGRAPLPTPIAATIADLLHAKWDCRLVTVTGRVMAATLDDEQPVARMSMTLNLPDGVVDVTVAHPSTLNGDDLLDATVTVTGVAGGEFNAKMQMSGVMVNVDSASGVRIVHPAASGGWQSPLVPIDQVVYAYRHDHESSRVRVEGTLTYYEPGLVAVIETAGQTLPIRILSAQPLEPGTVVEVTGFPTVEEETVWLEHAQMRSLDSNREIVPHPIDFAAAAAGDFAYNLVQMEGTIVAEARDARVDLFIVESADGHVFAATLRHIAMQRPNETNGISTPAVGSKVRVSGVCFLDSGNHWHDRFWFTLRMRSLADMALVEPPPFWSLRRMVYIVSALVTAIVLALLWLWLLRRRVREQTLSIAQRSREYAEKERRQAQLEMQRSSILEMVSKPVPLNDLLDAVAVMVSSRLEGAPCWFELAADLGMPYHGARHSGPSIESCELLARDGTVLGNLFVAMPLLAPESLDVVAAMRVGARLAEIAIDSRRLLRDLRHRSEYDLLTGVANRFSMERELNRLLLEGAQSSKPFGLIYVDLDGFKQVNDHYGHHTGDLYLTAVAQRIKGQLRMRDLLARIGGDEFVVLIPELRSREVAEEIVARIQQATDSIYEIQGEHICGAASVGLAVYPEDGTSMEALQKTADKAMYVNKEQRHSTRLITTP